MMMEGQLCLCWQNQEVEDKQKTGRFGFSHQTQLKF